MASRKESANWKCPQISSLQILLTEGAARPHPVPSPPPWLPHPHFPQGLCKRHLFLFLLSLFTSMGSTGKRLPVRNLGIVNRGCRSHSLGQNYLISISEVGWHQWSVKSQTNSSPRSSQLYLTALSSSSPPWTCPVSSVLLIALLGRGK